MGETGALSVLRRLGAGGLTREAAALAGVLLVPAWAVVVGTPGPIRVGLDLGPNDGSYLQGFAPAYEIDPDGLTSHWSTHAAAVRLPLAVEGGPVAVSWRYARVLAQTAVVEARLGDRVVDRYECRGGRWDVRRVALGALPAGTPLELEFGVDSHDRRDRGLRLDWLRWELGAGARVRVRGAAAWLPACLVAALFFAFRVVGHGRLAALGLSVPWSLGLAWWTRSDPLAVAHVASRAAVPGAALVLLAAWACRGVPGARWLPPVLAAGYLLKAALVFHPAFFYPDAMNHRRYVFALADAEGSLVERGVAAQVAVGTAYPRIVAGKAYAFPYSPLYFAPFTFLPRDAALVEDALRQSALLAAAGEVVAVFVLGRFVFGPAVAGLAALLAAFLPGMYSRLLLAMWPTVVGHLLDLGVVAAALALAASPLRRRLIVLAGVVQAALLTYISSLFNVGALLAALAFRERRLAARLVGVLAGTVGVTVALLYLSFSRTFVTEILPAVLGGARSQGAGTGAAWATLARIPDFFGWGYPALALAGLVLARRRLPPSQLRVLEAWGLAYLLLLGLRAFGAGLFKDLKEVLFLGPWVALLTAVSLEALARSGRPRRWAAGMVVIGLIAFGIVRGTETFVRFRGSGTGVTSITPAPTAPGESATLRPVPARWPTPSPNS